MDIDRESNAYQAFLGIVEIMLMDEVPVSLQEAVGLLKDGKNAAIVARWMQQCVDADLLWFDMNAPQLVPLDAQNAHPGGLRTVNQVRLFITTKGAEEYKHSMVKAVSNKRMRAHMRE